MAGTRRVGSVCALNYPSGVNSAPPLLTGYECRDGGFCLAVQVAANLTCEMQTPRPAYNPTHNQAGQSGQPLYPAQVPAHGARHPAIYPTPGQQHQPNPPGPMNHPTNNVPPAPGPMVPNSQSQPGHPNYSHGPVAPNVRPFMPHQQQSGQAQRQMIHTTPGNSAIGASPNFINQSYPMPATMASFTHGSHSVIVPANQVSTISHYTQPTIMQQPAMIQPMYTGRIPFAHGTPMTNFYLNSPYIASNYPAPPMVTQQNLSQNQNTVPNQPRAQPAPYTSQPAPNTSGTSSAPEIKSRPKVFARITDPNTGKDVTIAELKQPSPSSSQLPTAGESAPTTVPTTDSSSGTSLPKKQPPKPSKVPTSEEPKDSQSQQPQQQAPTSPLQQQQQPQPPPQLQTPQQQPQQQQQQPQQQQQQQQQQQPPPQTQQQQKPQPQSQPQQQQPPQQSQQPQPQPQPSQQKVQPPQPQPSRQQAPQPQQQHQEPQVTSTVELQAGATVEKVGEKESASIVKPDARKTESTSSDIQPAAKESVVKPALPRVGSAPVVATEAKPESVIEPLAKPVTISSENETSSNDLKSKSASEAGKIPAVEITKSSSPTEKATLVQVTSSAAVNEPSGQSTKQTTGTTDEVQKRITELSLNGDINESKDASVESPVDNSLKSEPDSKSLKSQSSAAQDQPQEPEPVSPHENEELMQYTVKGKYQYSRAQLIQLRSSPCCQEPPKLAQNIWDTLRNNSKPSAGIQRQGHDPFYPFPQASSGMPRNLMPNRGSLYSGRYSLDARTTTKKVIPAPPLLQDVKLHTTENAWKPELKKKAVVEVDTDEAKTNELLKTFRGYLNKITPQKYDVIEAKIKELTIDSEDRLIKVLNLIFDKAVDEPAFCVQYANLCNYLNTLKVPKVNEKGESEIVGFWRLLLTKCQEQFERDIYADVDIDGKTQLILQCGEDVEKKRLLEAELEEDKRRARKKSLGNMKLIGELYRLNMLNVKIMISCVQRLLFPTEEENIECLCTLLRTIGAKLESDCKEKQQSVPLDRFFQQLKSIADDIRNKKSDAAKLSSRVRFLILDVLDMRKNGWQERSIQLEDRPKTIQEIHAEVALQEEKQLQESIQYSQNRERRKNHTDGSYARKSQQGTNSKEAIVSVLSSLSSLKDTISQQTQQTDRLGFSTDFSAKWGKGSGAHTQSQANTNRPSQEQSKQEPIPKQQETDKKSPESGE